MIRVVARDGPRGVTHRAVADEAGVPLAATTYYFASRDEMIEEAFRLLARRESAQLRHGSAELPRAMSAGECAALLASLVASGLRTARESVLAEHEMHLEAGRRPELRETHRAWVDAALEFFTAATTAVGSSEPALDAAIVLSVIMGVQLGELANPDESLESEVLEPLLRRLLSALSAPAAARAPPRRGRAKGGGAPRS